MLGRSNQVPGYFQNVLKRKFRQVNTDRGMQTCIIISNKSVCRSQERLLNWLFIIQQKTVHSSRNDKLGKT